MMITFPPNLTYISSYFLLYFLFELQQLTFACSQLQWAAQTALRVPQDGIRNDSVITIRHFRRGQNPNFRSTVIHTPLHNKKSVLIAAHASTRKLCSLELSKVTPPTNTRAVPRHAKTGTKEEIES